MNNELDPKKSGVIIGIVVVIIGALIFFVGRQPGDRTGKKFKIVLSGPKATMKVRNGMPAGWVPGRPSSVNRTQAGAQPGANGGKPPSPSPTKQ